MDFIGWFHGNELFLQSTIVSIILACSVQVSLRAGVFSLASVGFYQVSMYTAAYFGKEGWPVLAVITVGVVVSAIGGWILARILVRLSGLYLAMATIAFNLMVGVLVLNWDSVTGGALGLYGIPVLLSFEAMVVVLVIVVVGLALLERGAVGRMFDMVREDPQVTKTSGVDPLRLQRLAFVLSAAIGSIAGSMHALTFNAISPADVNFHFFIMTLAMVIIGGMGSWKGAALGAIIVVWLPLQLRFLGDHWPAVYGAAMLFMATYAPDGLTGRVARGFEWLKKKRTPAAPPAEEGLVP